MPGGQNQQRAERAIELYLANHSHTLTPVPGNLQPASTAPTGEITFPLIVHSPNFNPSTSPHFVHGHHLLIDLAPIMHACDLTYRTIIDGPQYEYYLNINRDLRRNARLFDRMPGPVTAFHTMKLVVNVARQNAYLTCGHESPYCVVGYLGTATTAVDLVDLGVRTTPSGGDVMMFDDVCRLSSEVLNGTRYELQFFLPPAPRYSGSKAHPGAPTKKDGNGGGGESGGGNANGENDTDKREGEPGGSSADGASTKKEGGETIPAWVGQGMEHTDKQPGAKTDQGREILPSDLK